jgi:hypothetical protein
MECAARCRALPGRGHQGLTGTTPEYHEEIAMYLVGGMRSGRYYKRKCEID